MQKRIQSWEGRFLSKAGKEVLLKTVAQAIPSYAMSVFLLPLKTCSHLEQMMAKYWWHSNPKKTRGVTWVSWSRLCKHKSVGGLGFRSIRDYNLSLLGKQAWRLLNFENSLVGQIYKARYYPHSTFLNAKLGNNPSFIWRSIFETHSLIKAGARICIGNGMKTDILHTPWLPHDSSPYVATTHPGLNNFKVQSLMQISSREWDLEVVSDLFDTRDQALILSVPLSNNAEEDTWYWKKNATGFYTVKSAYQYLQEVKGAWGLEAEDLAWKTLWKIKVPPKVLHLIWKALSGCLPTKSQLQSKHVLVGLECPFCNNAAETIEHVLLFCNFSTSCWIRSGWGSVPAQHVSFVDWFNALISRQTPEIIEEGVMMCWSIWKSRNDVVWNQKNCSAADVVCTAKLILAQWKYAQSRKFDPLHVPAGTFEGNERWSKPDANMTKINVDGAVFAAENAYGSGMVVRDDGGRLIEATASFVIGGTQPELAEIMGIKEALSWVKRKGIQNVVIESDSLLSIQALESSIRMPSVFGLMVVECQTLLLSLVNVKICFVKRSANRVAHCVARNSCFWSGCNFVEGTAPAALQTLILADLAV